MQIKKFYSAQLKQEKGFNLIELMIVIAIIALLIGVGVPAWQAVVRSANETAAMQNMETLKKLQFQYSGKRNGRFAATFDELIRSEGLDENFRGSTPVVTGYIFTMKVEEPSGTKPAFFSVNADPQVPEGVGATGTRHFYFDSNLGNTVSTEENRPAGPQDKGPTAQ